MCVCENQIFSTSLCFYTYVMDIYFIYCLYKWWNGSMELNDIRACHHKIFVIMRMNHFTTKGYFFRIGPFFSHPTSFILLLLWSLFLFLTSRLIHPSCNLLFLFVKQWHIYNLDLLMAHCYAYKIIFPIKCGREKKEWFVQGVILSKLLCIWSK